MINSREKDVLCTIAIDSKKYGIKMPTQIQGQWNCPHCGYEHTNIDNLATHLSLKCDNPKKSKKFQDNA